MDEIKIDNMERTKSKYPIRRKSKSKRFIKKSTGIIRLLQITLITIKPMDNLKYLLLL